jgi:hypothetical protein
LITAARWLSVLLHPFVMVGIMVGVAAAARQTRAEAAGSVGIVTLFTIAPLAILMWRQVRQGRWQNVDASDRADRPVLYGIGGVALVALLAYLFLLQPESFMMRGVVAILAMMAVCAAATRWIKVSLHMAFATLAAAALALGRSPFGYGLLLTLPALVWARLVLQRHTVVEVALGTCIGALTAAVLHFL